MTATRLGKNPEQEADDGDGQRFFLDLDIIEEKSAVECPKRGGPQARFFVGKGLSRPIESIDAGDSNGDLKKLDDVKDMAENLIEDGQEVGIERRLEKNSRARPIPGRDFPGPPVVFLAVHGQLGEKRLVPKGQPMEDPQEKGCGENRQEQVGRLLLFHLLSRTSFS